MLDIKKIRENPQKIETLLQGKEPSTDLSSLLECDQKLRQNKTEVEELKSKRNTLSKEIGQLKRKGQDTTKLMTEVSGYGKRIQELDENIRNLDKEYIETLACLPNLPMDDVKVSQNIEDNVCEKEFGTKPEFDFPFKNHVELNEKLKLFDFKRGAKISGAGWPIYRDMGARLEWALINYMIDTNIKNGFTLWMPPHLVRPEMMFGVGQLPKFETQLFRLHDEHFHLYLIPTSEAALNSLHYDEALDEKALPLKYCAYTPCFRREAGAAGSQERGLIRMHQFNKVEMFSFARPEESMKIFDEMLANAEEILKGLGLHYRNMLLVTGDMSFAAARTVDIEVWLPGQNRYYEVSSVSNCTDFQSRRAHIRCKDKNKKNTLVHTLNGSALASSRLMVALLENNQNADGSVNIPEVLQRYLGGISKIESKKTLTV